MPLNSKEERQIQIWNYHMVMDWSQNQSSYIPLLQGRHNPIQVKNQPLWIVITKWHMLLQNNSLYFNNTQQKREQQKTLQDKDITKLSCNLSLQ